MPNKQPIFNDEEHKKRREEYAAYMSIPENRIRVRQLAKEWRENNPDRVRVNREKYLANHPGIVTKSYTKWRKNNPDKFHAKMYALRYAPIKGNCEVCGSTYRLSRHHQDYSKPLEVVTLCKKCHEIADKIRDLTLIQKVVVLANRHCSSCNKEYPNCERKVPSLKGKRGCTFWVEKETEKSEC